MADHRWQVTAYLANATEAASNFSADPLPSSSTSSTTASVRTSSTLERLASALLTTTTTMATTSTTYSVELLNTTTGPPSLPPPTTTQPLNITPEYAIDFGYNFTTEVAEDSACHFYPTTENYIIIIAFTIIFALSVIGNALVVIVVVQQRAMRSITNLYLLNLAITDLMLSVVCMPPTLVSSIINCWMFGNALCKLLAYLQPVVVTASAYTLAMIAVERYYAICRPLHSRVWQTRSHAYAMIALVWLVSVVANFLMLFMYELKTYSVKHGSADMVGLTCAPRFEPVIHFAYQIYMTVVLLLIPLIIMTVLYDSVDELDESRAMSMVSRLRSTIREVTHTFPSSKRIKNTYCAGPRFGATRRSDASSVYAGPGATRSLRSTHTEKSALARQRVIRMLLVVVIIFFCCWTPCYIWWLILMAADSFAVSC